LGFVNAALTSDPDDARAAMIQAVSELPQPNRDTIVFFNTTPATVS